MGWWCSGDSGCESRAAQEVPGVSAVRRSLIVANCLTRSAAQAVLSVELILVRLTILGVSFGRPKTYVALRRQTRKLPGESRMLSGGAAEIHQFFSDRIVNEARRRNAASLSFGSGPSWTMSLFGNRGLGPHSRIAGLLLFPLRPSRGNCLIATTGFRFQWRRNRFACRNVLLWCFPGRPNWRSR